MNDFHNIISILAKVCSAIGIMSILHGFLYKKTQKIALEYPKLSFPVPEKAENDFLFQAWCDANRFFKNEQDGRYYQKSYWWENGSMLYFQFKNNQLYMNVFERAKFLNNDIYFALNAPVSLNILKRRRKIKQLNKLIKHWGVPEIKL